MGKPNARIQLERSTGRSYRKGFVCVLGQDPGLLRAMRLHVPEMDAGLTGCATPSELTTLRQITDIGCVITPLRLPGGTAWDLLGELFRHDDPVPVVVFSPDVTVATAVQAMKAGAFDCVVDECPGGSVDVSTLVASVSRALAHGRWLRVKGGLRRLAERRISRLTHRERQVFQLVAGGLSSKQAAVRLGVSAKTVEYHRARMMKKMKAGNVAELVRVAYLLGMLNRDPIPVPPREGIRV